MKLRDSSGLDHGCIQEQEAWHSSVAHEASTRLFPLRPPPVHWLIHVLMSRILNFLGQNGLNKGFLGVCTGKSKYLKKYLMIYHHLFHNVGLRINIFVSQCTSHD